MYNATFLSKCLFPVYRLEDDGAIIRALSIISGAHQFHSLKEGGVMFSV